MNETLISTLYIIGVLIVMGISGFGLRYTWMRLNTRGAKSLFMLLFLLFAFTFIFFMSLFTRSDEGMRNIMLLAHAIILMIPFPWTAMVYEMNGRNTKDMWHFMVPWSILNGGGFLHLVFPLENMGEPMAYTSCSMLGVVNRCQIDHSPFYYALMGVLLFEILGANAYLFYYFLQPKQVAQRVEVYAPGNINDHRIDYFVPDRCCDYSSRWIGSSSLGNWYFSHIAFPCNL